ncbi:MAG: ATP-dependent helicase [Nitrospirae bacterium]|nr:ATP-dependent helicase [Nitrospirota bacterium]MBF0542632.1 ATP-dependent helicase [Nitrospirota bacterium]
MIHLGNVMAVVINLIVKNGLMEVIDMLVLNNSQKDAINFIHGIGIVVAVPGSGKTTVMTHRIGNLIKHGVAPESILGLTFTRNAVQSMRDKLKPILNEVAVRVNLSTIHSFCHTMLRNEGKAFDIIYGKEQIKFIRNVMKQLRIKDISIGVILREISLSKNNLILIDEFRGLYEGDIVMLKIGDIYEKYELEKSKKQVMDFDDLLVETYKLLRDNEEIRQKYVSTHIMVDEFQDTNPLQMEIIKLLIDDGVNSSFWVCGDDWQSIYSFQGASVGNILLFKDRFSNTQEFIFNMNYRSTPQILKACQNLIQYNQRKINKTLETDNDNGDEVILLECSTEEDEGVQLVNEVKDLISRKGNDYKDIAILYRANFQSRVIEEAFSENNIPYHVENGLNFYTRFEIKVLLDYLRVIYNPETEEGTEALISILNVPNRYISKKLTLEFEEYAVRHVISLYEALKKMPVKVPYLYKNIKELRQFLDGLMIEAQSMPPADLITLLRESLDYDRFITDEDIPSLDDSKIENINQLILSAARYNSIADFLNYTETFKDKAVNDKDGISLMTIHKAKGLEFPIVFVIGLVDGILPIRKSGDIEEERRIAFVAISRAMKMLYLSYFQTYCGTVYEKSRFIDEILRTDGVINGSNNGGNNGSENS